MSRSASATAPFCFSVAILKASIVSELGVRNDRYRVEPKEAQLPAQAPGPLPRRGERSRSSAVQDAVDPTPLPTRRSVAESAPDPPHHPRWPDRFRKLY